MKRLLLALTLLLGLATPSQGQQAPPWTTDNLLTIDLAPLPAGLSYGGIGIAVGNLSIGTGWKLEPSAWGPTPSHPQGYEGLWFKGTDPLNRTKIQAKDYAHTVITGRNAGMLRFENIEFLMAQGAGKQTCVWLGVDAPNKPDFVPATAEFINCKFTASNIPLNKDPQGRGEWALFTDAVDLVVRNSEFDTANLNEHPIYVHALGQYGMFMENVDMTGAGAIAAQLTWRPGPMYYDDPAILAVAKHANPPNEDWFHPASNAVVWWKNCHFGDWGQPWSWRGGAGLATQGVGISQLYEDCTWIDHNNKKFPAAAISDSGVEHFGAGSVAGADPANGDIIFRRCFFYCGPDGGTTFPPLIDMNQLTTHITELARSVRFEDCGMYGLNRRVSLRGVQGDEIYVTGCNTPAIKAQADALGIDTTNEAMLNINGGAFKPASQGHTP